MGATVLTAGPCDSRTAEEVQWDAPSLLWELGTSILPACDTLSPLALLQLFTQLQPRSGKSDLSTVAIRPKAKSSTTGKVVSP